MGRAPRLLIALTSHGLGHLTRSLAVAAALVSAGLPVPAQVDQVSIDTLFHEGAGRRSKGEFAFALALTMENPPHPVSVPAHISELFEFLHAGHAVVGAQVGNDAAPAAD